MNTFTARIVTTATHFPKGTIVALSDYHYENETYIATSQDSEVTTCVSADDVEREPTYGFAKSI